MARAFPSSDHYEVVVVGAGIGGLVTAAWLARAGRRVLVLDQHSVAGGSVSAFKRPGYHFDVGLHYVGDCGPRGVLPRVLRRLGLEEALEWIELDPEGFDSFFWPDMAFRMPRGLDRYEARLLERFPEQARGVRSYAGWLRQTWEALVRFEGLQDSGWRGPSALLGHLGGMASLGLHCPRFVRHLNSSLGQVLDSINADARLRAVLTAQCGTYAVEPERASALMHGALTCHYLQGAFYPRGGGQALSDLLHGLIEDCGGEVVLSTAVERIALRRGRAVGVQTRHRRRGVRFVSADAVVSNADLRRTYLELLGPGALPARRLARVAAYEMSLPLLVVYLGARLDAQEANLGNGNFWVYPGLDVDQAYRQARAGVFAEQPPVFISIASTKDPQDPVAPPGVTNLQLMGVVPPQPQVWGLTRAQVEDGSYRRVEAYRLRCRQQAERLVAMAERALPGLRRAIVFQEEASPFTTRRFTGASQGSPYGLAGIPSQFGLRRPDCRTEIPNLFLVGHDLRTGHGVGGAVASALAAASALLERDLWRAMGPRRP